jgi:hypothetical protein
MAVPVNPRGGGGGRLIVTKAVEDQIYGTLIYVPNAMKRSVSLALGDAAKPISRALYSGMENGVFPRGPMLRANQEIARRAQQAILSGWRARLPVKSGPYRRGSNPSKDRLSGALGEALAHTEMTSNTTAAGISFLNINRLAHDARHWYRVNYGAYGYRVPAIRRPKAYPVTVDGHSIFALQDEHQPATHSWLPSRFIWAEGGEFLPLAPANKEGGGHRAALFTDLGFKSVANNVDPVYREMLFAYFRKGGMKQRYETKGSTVFTTTKGNTRKT